MQIWISLHSLVSSGHASCHLSSLTTLHANGHVISQSACPSCPSACKLVWTSCAMQNLFSPSFIFTITVPNVKQNFRSIFSSKSQESLNLDVLDARPTDIPPINTSFLAAQAKENSVRRDNRSHRIRVR